MTPHIRRTTETPWWAKTRWILLTTLALVMLSALSVLMLGKLVPILARVSSAVFRHAATGWVEAARPVGVVAQLRVTRGGTVWALTWNPGGLSRLEGASWKQYGGSDFGARSGDLSGGFAIDGEQVWGAASSGVVHFDGQRWRLWREAVATPDASNIVAAKGEAWVVDEAGNLSHYADGVWHIGKLALPGVSWDNKAPAPRLALAPDGSLWLIRRGVWRLDGAGWSPISCPGRQIEDATLLGIARGRLWLAERDEVLSVAWDGRAWTRHTLGEMGLPAKTLIHEVDGADTAWFATSAGALSFDGAAWHLIPPPGPRMRTLWSVAAGPDGTVWVVGTQRTGLSTLRFAFLALAVLGLLAMLALPVWMHKAMTYRAKRQQELIRRVGERLPAELRPWTPPPAAQPQSSVAEKLLPLILALGAVFLLQRVWPQPGGFSILAVFIAYELFGSVLHSLKRREVKPSDPIGPGAPPKYDLRRSIGPMLWTLLLFAVMRLDWMLEKLHLRSPGLVFLLPLVLFGLAAGGSLLLAWFTDRAVARCDYDGALRLARLFFWKTGGAAFVRGDILLKAGRYPEAEAVLREGLRGAPTLVDRFMMLEDLGNVLMDTGRNEEAQRCFESARDLKPDRSVANRAMAELVLRQGKETERALELAGRALELYQGSAHERMTCPERLGETLAVHAWALVLRGPTSEAIEQIEQALQGRARKNRPAFAHVRFLAGMAMRALGRRTEAAEHFRGGREVDPSGRWGTLCAAALREPSFSGAEPFRAPIH